MIRNILYFFIMALLGTTLFLIINSYLPFGQYNLTSVAKYYVEKGVKDLGSINIVTSIVTLYRGFDTLGEVTVLFLALTGLSFLLAGLKRVETHKPNPTLVMETGGRYLFPLIILFGAYIFIHGHLTPGGGFPGGVIIATAFLMLFITQRMTKINKISLSLIESAAGISYVFIGILGLVFVKSFLGNFLKTGKPGYLVSAGIIPLIYITIGIKVGSEMTSLLKGLKEGEDD
ncbi:MAG: Na(+)/H(+) antiporter subunit B [candidate division WOR-3 bacterium]